MDKVRIWTNKQAQAWAEAFQREGRPLKGGSIRDNASEWVMEMDEQGDYPDWMTIDMEGYARDRYEGTEIEEDECDE